MDPKGSVDFMGTFWWRNVCHLAVNCIKRVDIKKKKKEVAYKVEVRFLKQHFCSGDYGLCNKLDFNYLAASLVLQPSGEAACSSIADLFKLNLYKSLLN